MQHAIFNTRDINEALLSNVVIDYKVNKDAADFSCNIVGWVCPRWLPEHC